ncbi:MAG: hypothetical protein Ta2B_10600 [Termitinemataceae bacterium]|nr:MAG: hypothetical protein Ta2B_10600 [Termitinemataceae bacterium]
MDLFGVGSLLGGIGQGAFNWFATKDTNETNARSVADTNAANERMAQEQNAANERIAQENLKYQREVQDYNKWAQQETWNREDNSIQRRVADMKSAGLSPVLAAGNGAATSQPIKLESQNNQMQYNRSNAQAAYAQAPQLDLGMITQLMLMKTQIEKTEVEKKAIAQQTQKVEAETKNIDQDTENKKQDYDYREALNPESINKLKADIAQVGQKTVNDKLEANLKRFDISTTAIKRETMVINQSRAAESLTETQKDIIAKTIAIQKAENELKYGYNTGVDPNLIKSMSGDVGNVFKITEYFTQLLGNQVRKGVKLIKEKGGKK